MNDTADRIIFASLAVLFVMGMTAFWANPAYKEGVYLVMGAAGSALSGALGFKFGISTAGSPPPGSTTDTTVKQVIQTPPAK